MRELILLGILFFHCGLPVQAQGSGYSSGYINQSGSGFWLGARNEEVYSKQGVPDSVEHPNGITEIWRYGQSTVTITNGAVSAYDNTGKNLRLQPSFPNQPGWYIQPNVPLANTQSVAPAANNHPPAPAESMDYIPYMQDIQRHVRRFWQAPQSCRVGVEFTIHRNGQISNLRVIETSGSEQTDASVVRAIEQSLPLRSPPGNSDNVDMKMTFATANGDH